MPAGLDLDITLTPDEGTDESDRKIVEAVTRISDTLAADATEELVAAATAFDVYGLFAALTDIAGAMIVASPLLFAADHFARQWDQVQRILKEWRATDLPDRSEHLAVFSDSRDNIDGVASWCRRFMCQAETAGRRVWFASCDDVPVPDASSRAASPIASVARFKIPLYPRFEVVVPSFPEPWIAFGGKASPMWSLLRQGRWDSPASPLRDSCACRLPRAFTPTWSALPWR